MYAFVSAFDRARRWIAVRETSGASLRFAVVLTSRVRDRERWGQFFLSRLRDGGLGRRQERDSTGKGRKSSYSTAQKGGTVGMTFDAHIAALCADVVAVLSVAAASAAISSNAYFVADARKTVSLDKRWRSGFFHLFQCEAAASPVLLPAGCIYESVLGREVERSDSSAAGANSSLYPNTPIGLLERAKRLFALGLFAVEERAKARTKLTSVLFSCSSDVFSFVFRSAAVLKRLRFHQRSGLQLPLFG